MPSISRGVLCLGCVVFAVQGQTITNRPIFIGREPLTGSQKTTFLDLFAPSVAGPRPSNFVFPARNVLLANPIIDPRVTARYGEVVANKSLLINDCDSFCDDPFFSFGRIVERAANATAIPHPEKTAGDWYNGLDGVVPDYRNHVKPWSGSNSDQFQLLAVVNRLDMATPGVGDTWVGAELRFVYGARTVSTQTGPEPFSVIVEFVLPALHWKDFRGMAGAWHDLRRLQGAAFVTQLKTLLQEARSPVSDKAKVNCSPLVRIRTNSVSGSGGAPWFFAQWELFKGKLRQWPESVPR